MNSPVLEKQGDNRFLLRGELNMHSVNTLARASVDMLMSAGGDISIDFSQVERADSAGLALLIEWQRVARRRGVEIRFSHLPEQLMQIARVSELDSILPIES